MARGTCAQAWGRLPRPEPGITPRAPSGELIWRSWSERLHAIGRTIVGSHPVSSSHSARRFVNTNGTGYPRYLTGYINPSEGSPSSSAQSNVQIVNFCGVS
ncbi:hypothetical protein AG1IA_06185 [Rhizoctonia solani AG-1 IA]|uniref:Uncharacterized protein n=1 Tax=Thanatephorus cucumeris (strain AG1-IA) TaxID=983506 RepID=L8WSM4_THACA|nr:hypothetical protein AG1IA_06185 [Rhizoctonia solani AG-1 IA]